MNLENKINKTKVLIVEENMDFLEQALNLSSTQTLFYEDVERTIANKIKKIEEDNVQIYSNLKKEGIELNKKFQYKIKANKLEELETQMKKFFENEKTNEILRTYQETITPATEFDLAINSKTAIDSINALKYDAVLTSDLFNKEIKTSEGIKERVYDDSAQGIEIAKQALANKAEVYFVSAPRGTTTFPNGYKVGIGKKTTSIEYDEDVQKFAKENNIPVINANVNELSKIADKNFEKAYKNFAKEKGEDHIAFLKTTPEKYVNSLIQRNRVKINTYATNQTKKAIQNLYT